MRRTWRKGERDYLELPAFSLRYEFPVRERSARERRVMRGWERVSNQPLQPKLRKLRNHYYRWEG